MLASLGSKSGSRSSSNCGCQPPAGGSNSNNNSSSSSSAGDASRPTTSDRPASEPAWSIFGVRSSSQHVRNPRQRHHHHQHHHHNFHGLYQGPESEPEVGLRDGDIQFAGVALIDFLDLDARPIFAVDLLANKYTSSAPAMSRAASSSSSSVTSHPSSSVSTQSLPIIYYNQALQDAGNLLEMVEGSASSSPYGQPAWVTYPVFRAWVLDLSRSMFAAKKGSIVYGGMRWSATTVRRRWKVLSGEAYRHRDHLTGSFSNIQFSTKAVGKEPEKVPEAKSEDDWSGKSGDYLSAKSADNLNETSGDYLSAKPEICLSEIHEEENTPPEESWQMEEKTEWRKEEEDVKLKEFGVGRAESGAERFRKGSLKNERRHSLPPPVEAVPLTPGTSTYYRQSSIPANVRYDWTCTPPPPNLAPHVQLIRGIDWANTPLGPIDSWSPTLKFMCNLIMACPNPAIVFWGPELNMIYNEAYIPIAGAKHPSMLGVPPWVAFQEAWDDFEPFLRNCEESGCGAMVENMLLFLNRGAGLQEEFYCSFSFTPILENDKIVGWHEVVFETTKQMITERRISTLLTLSEKLSTSLTLKSFWEQTLEGLQSNSQDVCFAVLYSVSDLAGESHLGHLGGAERSSSRRYELEGSIGVPEGHPATSTRLDVALGRDCFMRYFRTAAESNEPLFLSIKDGTLPEALVHGIESRAWNEPCDSVVICAIRPTTGHASTRDTALGFLVIGLNHHRPYDDEYRTFVQLLNRQFTTYLASVLLLEEETRRGRTVAEQAALDQQKIEEQLQLRTRELEQSELQLQHFADAIPIGIFILEFTPDNMGGSYRYRNEKWFELMGDSRENIPSWKSPLWKQMHPEDLPAVQLCWKKLMEEKTEQSFEFRIPRRGEPTSPVDENMKSTWILCHAFSVVTDDGWLRSIVGSVTDITTIKWAEGIQKRKMEDAIEAKRQQENFIDVTSHEMRNPLSAIMISADDIIASLKGLKSNSKDFELVIENSIDAANTVLHCAQHQKRIVDDILTISKLDSGLFSINPIEVQPVALINDLSKMFAGEYNAAGITQTTVVEDSFKTLGVDWVLLDSSRLTQILINLITNSIKFTQYQSTREIKIRIGASKEKPTVSAEGIQYLDFRMSREDLTQRREWGNGEELYLHFSVSDTGCGLTVDEKKLLFMRFSQAPRTMVHYGGSGLGLFICRELTELQGGSIGVDSESGKGSTFAFYIKTRRLIPRETELPSRPTPQGPELTALQQLQNIDQTFEQPLLPRKDQYAPSPYSNLPTRPSSPTTTVTTTNTTTSTHSIPSSVPFGPRPPFDCLIVEDNKVNQSVMSKGLVKLGHTVFVANHGAEALEFLRTTKHWRGNTGEAQNLSVVLMDIEMPVMDGLTCVREIRRLEREGSINGRIKVIAITANARVEQVNTAMQAGMDDVVSKPFRVAELISSIERLVDAKEPRVETVEVEEAD
ncbi:Histidine protein kinase NIK1 [Lasiodiplodia theobromae]|uniref:Histidine protein kinase NIK1 n=1 Tax=Lasiodiplodia theobromae TaxID=45133 RepID=A0A5N5DP55_9PEZI|nr:Histidine protein kinase NIK1 [Lasiodiplodia theobromae]